MTVVAKGDWIAFNLEEKQSVQIEWQQNFAKHREPYICLPYSVIDKEASGSLYIQKSFSDKFFKSCQKYEGDNPLVSGHKIEVTDSFQYGQNNDQTLRFLVYHDKNNKPYQHRFIETTAFANVMNKLFAAGEMSPAAAPIIEQLKDIGKAFIGDYLRDF